MKKFNFTILGIFIWQFNFAQYCGGAFSYMDSLVFIDGVSINGFNNLNTGVTDGQTYRNYTNLGPIQLTMGQTYQLNVEVPSGQICKVAVFMDFDNDNTFSNNELIDVWANYQGHIQFNIPIYSYFGTGQKRLRLRAIPYGITDIHPCFEVMDTYPGETEDYTVNITSPGAVYCTPWYSVGTQNMDYINGVVLNTMKNENQLGVDSFPYYANFTNSVSTTTLYARTTYLMRVYGGINPGFTYTAWLDYNRDSVFSFEERLGEVVQTTNPMLFLVSFPLTASEGLTRLRIRCEDSPINGIDPCTNLVYGETEDYHVNIQMNSPGYCTQGLHPVNCNQLEVINTVTIVGTTLNNQNTGCDNTTTGYVNWPVTSYTTASLDAFNTYTLNVTTAQNSQIFGWIDYNHDNVFSSSEVIEFASNSTANTPASTTFFVPGDALPGPTKMRIRNCSANGELMYSSDACMPFNSGQTEDYTINIVNTSVGIRSNDGNLTHLNCFVDDSKNLHIHFTNKFTQKTNFTLLDAMGKMVKFQTKMQEIGDHQELLNLSDLAEGIYYFNFQQDGLTKGFKFSLK